ncbi:unnamed protein product, partial [Ectocarpus sp. 12 AP-2014]
MPSRAPRSLDVVDAIISCGSWECGAGYTNIERDCSTDPSPYSRRRLRSSLDSGSNDVLYSTDGNTTLGNYPMCRQDNCCEELPAPTPSPTAPGPTPAPSPTPEPVQGGTLSLGCCNDDGDDRIMDDRALVDTLMTTELCELTCAGSSYFSTQHGQECWCGPAGTDYEKHGESTECTYEC